MGSLKMLELKPVRGFDQKTGLLSVWTSVHWCAGSGFSQQIARLWPWTLLTSVTPVTKKHIWGPRWRECWHGHESNTVGLSQPSATNNVLRNSPINYTTLHVPPAESVWHKENTSFCSADTSPLPHSPRPEKCSKLNLLCTETFLNTNQKQVRAAFSVWL